MQNTGRIGSGIRSFAAVLTVLFTLVVTARANVKAIPPTISFGSQAVGTTSASQTVTVMNSTRFPVRIVRVQSTSPEFSYSGPAVPAYLSPGGGSLTVAVTFTPSAAQTAAGILVFTRANGSTVSVALSGTGTGTGNGGGTGTGTGGGTTDPPETIDPIAPIFFSGAVGSTIAPKSFTVTDSSPIGVTFSATSDSPWLSVTQSSLIDSPGNIEIARVNTAGLAKGTYTGHIVITIPNQGGFTFTNSPMAVPVTLTLTGGGTTATAPTITSQPASLKIVAGQPASFNVAATGTAPLTYQWNKGGSPINGANSSSYTIPSVTTGDNNAQFTVVVGNSVGSATSNSAVLTVTSTAVAPAITTQPASQTVVAGKSATFNVAATGTAPLTYQWSRGGSPINGANSSSYTIPTVANGDNNAQFTVVVTNSAGSATSNAATLTVTAAASGILNSSASTLSFGNVNVSGSSSKTVTLKNAGNADVTISNVTVSGAGFNASGVPTGLVLTPGQTATLTATFAPAAPGSVTGSVSVASNASNTPDSISLLGTGVAAANHTVTVSWSPSASSSIKGYNTYSSTVSGGPYSKLTGAPVSATSYTDSSVVSGQTYFYVVTAVDSGNAESVFSSEVSATIP
jgi:hypothetical protein